MSNPADTPPVTPTPTPTPQPTPTPTPTPTPQPTPTPEPTPDPNAKPLATADELYAFMRAIDPRREGIGLDKVRPLYRKTGWDKILAVVKQLEDSGRVTKRAVLNRQGGTAYEVYTWKDA